MLTPCGLLILSPADLNGKRLLRSFRNLPCDGYDLLVFWNETQQKQARAFYGTARKGCPAVAGEHKCRQGMLSGACVHSAECTKLRNASDREYRFRLLNFPPYLYFSEAEPALSRLCLIFSPLRLSFRPPLCLTLLSLRLPLSLRLLCRSHAVFSRSSVVCLPFTHRSPRRLPVVSPAINRLACRSSASPLPFTRCSSAAPCVLLAAPCRIVCCGFDFVIRTKNIFSIRNFTRRQFANSVTRKPTKNAAARKKCLRAAA